MWIHNEDWRRYYIDPNVEDFFLQIAITEIKPLHPVTDTKQYGIALRCDDLDEFHKPVRDKLRETFKETMHKKQLDKTTVSIPEKSNPTLGETALLKEIIPIITKMIRKIAINMN